jgi:glycosyltransferase involved in cell wall biosynthesis
VPRASLVLPTRNRSRVLARTLAALTRQRERDFEVVIADDGSDDDTPTVVRGFEDRLDLRYLRRAHRGIAAARSAAMRAARGAILIQTDDDRVPAPDFVGDHLAAHADGTWVVAGHQRGLFAEWSVAAELPAAAVAAVVARDPALAAVLTAPTAELVTPEALADDLDGALARLGVIEPWWDRHGGELVARFGPTLDGYAFPWALAIGGNTSVPAALAASIGHLDEQFVGWGLEDTDFHFRLCQAGARVKVVPGAVSYHQLHRRGPELGRQWLANAVRLLDKHAELALSSYVVAVLRQTPLLDASAVAMIACAAAPEVQAELVRCHRELVAGR